MDKCIARISFHTENKASLDPIQIYDAKEDKWEPITVDNTELFPPNGVIFYPRKEQDNDIELYSYVLCQYEENPRPPSRSQYDKMLATSYIPLRLVFYPCVEQNENHPFENIRTSSTKIGATIKEEGVLSKEVYINVKENVFIKANYRNGILDIYCTPNDKISVPTYILSADDFIDIGDFSYTPQIKTPEHGIWYLACDNDGDFVRFIVHKLTNYRQNIYSKTTKELKEIRDSLLSLQENSINIERYDTKQMRAHIESIILYYENNHEFIAYVDKIARSSEAFKTRFEFVLREEIEKRHAEIEESLKQERRQLELLRKSIASFSSDNKAIIEQLKSSRLEKNNLHLALQEEKKRICTVLSTVTEGEMPYARTFAARLEEITAVSNCTSALPNPVAPWARPQANPSCRRVPERDLEQRLKEEKLPADGETALFWMDGLLRAGEPVWLVGPGREWLLTRYATCVAGGHIARMQADPSTLNIDDVWRLPGTREITALARAWAAATAMPDTTHLVALHVAGSPCHLWFPALGRALRSTERPHNLLLVLLPDNLPCPNESIDAFLDISEAIFCPSVMSLQCYTFNLLADELPQPTMLTMELSRADVDKRREQATSLLSSIDPWKTKRRIAFVICSLLPSTNSLCWPLDAEQIAPIKQGREHLREYSGQY